MARSSSIVDAAGSFSGSVASAEKRRPLAHHPRKRVVDHPRPFDGDLEGFDVHARCGEREHLRIDGMFVEHALPVVDVAVPGTRML